MPRESAETHGNDDDTPALLARWREGDDGAVDLLIARCLDWLVKRVHARLGGELRRVGDTSDFVNYAVVSFFKSAPSFHVETRAQLRGLLAKVVENSLRDKYAYWFLAERRSLANELPMEPGTSIDLSPVDPHVTPPDERAVTNEAAGLFRLAVELLSPDDQQLVIWHREGVAVEEIASRCGISYEAAKKRGQRAMGRLAKELRRLMRGDLPEIDS